MGGTGEEETREQAEWIKDEEWQKGVGLVRLGRGGILGSVQW